MGDNIGIGESGLSFEGLLKKAHLKVGARFRPDAVRMFRFEFNGGCELMRRVRRSYREQTMEQL